MHAPVCIKSSSQLDKMQLLTLAPKLQKLVGFFFGIHAQTQPFF